MTKPLTARMVKCPTCKGIRYRRCLDCQGRGYHWIDKGVRIVFVEKIVTRVVEKKVHGIPRGGVSTRRARQANVQCVDCGDPNLATRTRCFTCNEAHKAKERISA